jgi:RNA polymerase sigma-70 factor (ECF subfamily)
MPDINFENDAFYELYRKFGPEIIGFLFYLVKNYHSAEDLAQETFLKFFRYGYMFTCHSDQKTRSCLYKIAKNCFLDDRKKRRPIVTELNENLVINDKNPLKTDAGKEENWDSLKERLMGLLTPEEYITIILKFREGLKLHEIAERFDESLSAVKSRCSRALEKLRNGVRKEK